MWNLVGFMVMVGVLLTVRWALGIWDSTHLATSPVEVGQANTRRREPSGAA